MGDDIREEGYNAGRLVLDWQFTDGAMTYLSYATGYKSGSSMARSFPPKLRAPMTRKK